MNTKLIAFLCAAAVSGAFLAGPVSSEEIVVSPSARLAQAVKTVSQDLDDQLANVSMGSRDGFAVVRFSPAPDGGAREITLYRSSGSAWIDRGAMRAVARLSTVGEIAAASPNSTIVQANVIKASNNQTLLRLKKQAQNFGRGDYASRSDGRAVIALTSGATNGG